MFDEKEIYPYITEGIGEDILPENVDFSLIDAFEKVTDKDAATIPENWPKKKVFLLEILRAAIKGLLQLKGILVLKML